MKTTIGTIALFVLAIALAWAFWMWSFCRFYVGPNQMAIITKKTGEPLPQGQILAQPGQQGVQEAVLGEGRHFRNPITHDWEIVPAVFIAPGRVGLVTSKVGDNLPPGEFLAEPGQKGIWRQVLGPGKYRMNPVGYRIDVVDAVSVPVGYAGLVTSLSGRQAAADEFAGPGEKGIRPDILQPGLYYINPREFTVNILEIGVNQVSLLGKKGSAVITKGQLASQNIALADIERSLIAQQQDRRAGYLQEQRVAPSAEGGKAKKAATPAAKTRETLQAIMPSDIAAFVLEQFVEFPSRDGFEISLDMTVEFELFPRNLPWLYRSYGDLPAAVDKVLMPQILSISRLKGSAYGARDFIVGEGREKFQKDLTETLANTLDEKRIHVHSALIRQVNVPMQILEPIQQASIALETDLTNREKQNTAKRLAELNTQQSLIGQRREQVAQETEKIKAEINADQKKQVAEIQADTMIQAAQIEKATAGIRAEQATRLGKANADSWQLVQGEQANGYQLKIQAYGDPWAYSLLNFAERLNEDIQISIVHAGDGTLWTDLRNPTLGELGAGILFDQDKPKK